MKSIFRYVLVTVCVVAVAGSFATAQDLSEQLNKVGAANVQNYITPIFNGFASDLNSAFYHSADLHDILGFDVGLKVGLARVTDAQKTYDFISPSNLSIKSGNITVNLQAGPDYDEKVVGVPTAVGKDEAVPLRIKQSSAYYNAYKTLNGGSDVLFEIPKGLNLPAVPLMMPQAAVGLPFGLEVMFRFVPDIKVGDVGKFNYMGFGLRYSISQWLPLFPVDIAAHFMTQKMNFKSADGSKDVFKATGTAYGVEVSKKLLFITLYGGFQIEKASFTLGAIDGKLTTAGGVETPFHVNEMTITGENKSRATVGLRLLLLIINIHAEYSFAKTPVAALGVGISLR